MKPDFLGIGAQKSGTTWLDRNLRRHPGIWLPPVKELHYFSDRAQGLPGGPLARLFAGDWANRRLRGYLRARLRSDARHLDVEGLRWDLRFFFGARDGSWYGSLFDPAGERVAGEITPAYSAMAESEVRRVKELLPDLRLILLLRDPIDRSWSQLRQLARRRGTRVEDMDPERVLALVRSGRFGSRGNYPRTLENWGAHFAPERFFVGFLEDVAGRPRALLLELFGFLGVEADERAITGLAEKRIHSPGNDRTVPRYLERELASLHVEELRETERLLGGPAKRWLERAEKVLGGVA